MKKLWLISKFPTSQTGHGIITILILTNISRSKRSQTMKFGQLMKYSMRNIFLDQHLGFPTLWQSSTWTCNKNKLHNISDCWPRGMHNFDFIIKGSGTSSFNTFCVWFFKNIFLTLNYINWPNFMCIVIICCPACNVINVKISHGFLIKTFSYMTKKSGQKCKYLKNYLMFQYLIFHHFQRPFTKVMKNKLYGRWELGFKYFRIWKCWLTLWKNANALFESNCKV